MNDNPLQLLLDDDGPGTTLTPDLLVASGRRRVRRRRTAVTGVAAALVLVVTVGVAAFAGGAADRRPQPPAGPGPSASVGPSVSYAPEPDCTQHSLAAPGGGGIESVKVDATGNWAVGLRSDHRGVVLWHDGEFSSAVTDVDVTSLAGISSKGVAAGTGAAPDGKPRALTFNGTYAAELHRPAGALSTSAFAINGAGDVVGVYEVSGGGTRAVEWRRSDPLHPRALAAPSGQSATAQAIADSGDIGGSIGGRPYAWPVAGQGLELPAPSGAGATVVDGLGAGYAFDLHHGVRWLPGPGAIDAKTGLWPAGLDALAVAADGTVLLATDRQVVLWRERGITELPRPAGATAIRAMSVNHDASVAGGVAGGPAAGLPVLWRCGRG